MQVCPRPVTFRLHEECVGTGKFPHMGDVKGRKVVERTLNMGELGLRTARRSKVPGNLPQSCIRG